MTAEVEKPPKRGGNKSLYIDLGVINFTTIWFKGLKQPIAYSGRATLSDWWYWTKRIAKEQSRLAKTNSAKTSRKLRKLYRIRQWRFKHAVNTMIKSVVETAYGLGISKIVLGRLKGIRRNNHSGKTNTMINNFWSFDYIIRRFKEKAEEYSIEVIEVGEYKTSSTCPFCGSEDITTKGRLFKCLNCRLEANRDAVGVLNIGLAQGAKPPAEAVNGAVAHPLLLRWDGMR
ncbi:MAG: transposase, partial [Candidatus Methanomethylicaceae archaeon]